METKPHCFSSQPDTSGDAEKPADPGQDRPGKRTEARRGSPPAHHLPLPGTDSSRLTTAILNLSEDISALRAEVADLRSDLRSVREQNHRQDSEIWAQDGTTRLEANRAVLASHSLQIKGLWATLTLLIGAALSYASYHLR